MSASEVPKMCRIKMFTWSVALVVVGAAIPSLPVAAATPPPSTPQLAWPGIALQAKPSTGVWMGSLHVVLEQATLFVVRKAAGVGVISSQGEAGEGISWLCYTNVSPTTPERIWISTQREMGGPEKRVMGVTAQLVVEGVATADCPALPPALTPVRIDNGLWLNDTAREVANALHTGVNAGRMWQQFSYSGKAPGSGGCRPEGFNLQNGLAVKLRNGRVAFLQLSQVTSC
jgi:hypothetical protein